MNTENKDSTRIEDKLLGNLLFAAGTYLLGEKTEEEVKAFLKSSKTIDVDTFNENIKLNFKELLDNAFNQKIESSNLNTNTSNIEVKEVKAKVSELVEPEAEISFAGLF